MTVAGATSHDTPRFRMSRRARRALLTAHIVSSVGLLGDTAGVLAIALRGATTDDPELAHACWQLLDMFGFVFGIPLSFAALATGITLGLSSKWGVFRYPWVTAKLAAIVSVILVGALVIGPANAAMLDGEGGGEARLVAAGAWDVIVLTLATGLSVYKPGRRRKR